MHRSARSFRWRLQAAPARRSGQALSRFSNLCPIQTWSASPQGLGRRGKSRQLEKEIVISGTGSADSLQRANGGRTKSFLVRIRHREGKYPTSALPLAADADRSAVLFWQRSPGNARAVFSALWQSIKACIQWQVHHARTPCVIRCSCLYLRRCR